MSVPLVRLFYGNLVMNYCTLRVFPILFILYFFITPLQKTFAQTTVPPKIFLNCIVSCDKDYARSELKFFDFVRDRYVADIEILINGIRTGSGGFEYTLTFYGYNHYKSISDTVTFVTQQADTRDMIPERMVKNIKVGLIKYILGTDLIEAVSIGFPKTRVILKEDVNPDKWNFWVF
jgi:hypothetical protein